MAFFPALLSSLSAIGINTLIGTAFLTLAQLIQVMISFYLLENRVSSRTGLLNLDKNGLMLG